MNIPLYGLVDDIDSYSNLNYTDSVSVILDFERSVR